MDKHLLILDLDETLVYATEQPLPRTSDFEVGPYHAYLRPHLRAFVEQASAWYKLAVWTSASRDYAQLMVQRLLLPVAPLEFVWSAERCVRRFNHETQEQYSIKDLKKVKRSLGFPLNQILVVDDSPEKLERNFGNHLRVKPFMGDVSDTELRDIIPFLDYLRTIENVRGVEKRNWKNHASIQMKP